jgi:hypothetical protein
MDALLGTNNRVGGICHIFFRTRIKQQSGAKVCSVARYVLSSRGQTEVGSLTARGHGLIQNGRIQLHPVQQSYQGMLSGDPTFHRSRNGPSWM